MRVGLFVLGDMACHGSASADPFDDSEESAGPTKLSAHPIFDLAILHFSDDRNDTRLVITIPNSQVKSQRRNTRLSDK